MIHIGIIGGGASGLIAASLLVELFGACNRNHGIFPSVHIDIFESSDKIGRSILRSGNGRCNFSNTAIEEASYNDPDFVSEVFYSLERAIACLSEKGFLPEKLDKNIMRANPVLSYFETHSMMTYADGRGQLYPKTNKSSTVLDILKRALKSPYVQINLNTKVISVDEPIEGKKVAIHLEDGRIDRFDYLIVAAGGKENDSFKDLLPFVTINPIRPILGPIDTLEDTKSLDNIRVRCNVSIQNDPSADCEKDLTSPSNCSCDKAFSEDGEILFRKYGLSGIAIFNASRYLEAKKHVIIDFLPEIENMSSFMENRLSNLKETLGRVPLNIEVLEGIVLERVGIYLLDRLNMDPNSQFERKDLDKLISCLKKTSFEFVQIADTNLCQVVRGGYKNVNVDASSLELKDNVHIFITGEALDVDGPCGGYNLHWAFSTGMLAAMTIFIRSIKDC